MTMRFKSQRSKIENRTNTKWDFIDKVTSMRVTNNATMRCSDTNFITRDFDGVNIVVRIARFVRVEVLKKMTAGDIVFGKVDAATADLQ